MMVSDIEALAAIAPCLSVLTAGAWLVRQRRCDSGCGHTLRAPSAKVVGVAGALWPARILRSRGARSRHHQLSTSTIVPLPSQQGVVT
jgi:hypothetical protein